LLWEVVVRFVDICGIIVNHCFNWIMKESDKGKGNIVNRMVKL
jgi:hypothetical protein